MSKEIKKPWCTYGVGYPAIGYGKIEKETKEVVWIRYSEGQHYPLQLWENSKVWIKRYNTLEEAAMNYQDEHNNGTDLRMDHPINDMELKEFMRAKFPSYFKEGKKK